MGINDNNLIHINSLHNCNILLVRYLLIDNYIGIWQYRFNENKIIHIVIKFNICKKFKNNYLYQVYSI